MRATDTPEQRKARGAFFTPPEVCAYIAAWAIRRSSDVIFEPSCGEAAFLLAAGDRLRELGADPDARVHLRGVDLHRASVDRARRLAKTAGLAASLSVGDFFDFSTTERFDAVIGNPPYVRYQGFAGDARAKAREAALEQGVPLTALASSWAAFVVQSAALCAPTGRLGLVLPAELLNVNYAAPVRSFLLRTFGRVSIVMFEERVFPGVMEEIVLLLAEEHGGSTDHFELFPVRNADDMPRAGAAPSIWKPEDPGDEWGTALIGERAASVYARVTRDSHRFVPLLEWGDPTLGMVTGNNKWFTLSADEVSGLGLDEGELMRISPPGSRHLRGIAFDEADWDAMEKAGARAYLFRPAGDPSPAARARITAGEKAGVNAAYKCRVRTPWWRVPLVAIPELFFTYMNADAPRLVANYARVGYLNSVHGLRLAVDHRELGMAALPLGMLNSVSLLGAELVGRSYGGGILKLEPKEADRLPVSTPVLLQRAAPALRAIREKASALLTEGRLDDVIPLVDDILLVGEAGLSLDDVALLRAARARMHNRRASRTGV